jgi:GntR family transcriptional regulator
MSVPSKQQTTGDVIRRRFFSLGPAGLSKHVQLRQSIIDAIEQGELEVRAKLPPEKTLGELLGISLGTAQKALGSLASEGYLVREQGNGTFVGKTRRPMQGLWHFRFTDPHTRQHLPVTATLVQVSRIHSDGPWTEFLGHDAEGYVRVDRIIDIDGKFKCLSELYLPAATCAGMLTVPKERLENVNLKAILETDFGLPTIASSGKAKVTKLKRAEIAELGSSGGNMGLSINVTAWTKNRVPLSFQKIVIPATEYELDVDFVSSP